MKFYENGEDFRLLVDGILYYNIFNWWNVSQWNQEYAMNMIIFFYDKTMAITCMWQRIPTIYLFLSLTLLNFENLLNVYSHLRPTYLYLCIYIHLYMHTYAHTFFFIVWESIFLLSLPFSFLHLLMCLNCFYGICSLSPRK